MGLFWTLEMSRFPAEHGKPGHGALVLRNFPLETSLCIFPIKWLL